MSQLGERLRGARESQGISLAQAAIETRILQRYLVALEDGDYQHLPGDVYARGFVRNYAQYLGIPADELIEQYRRERGGTEPIRVVPATSSPRIRGVFIPSFFGVFFVVLALIGVSYLGLTLTNQIGQSSEVAVLPTTTTVPTPSPLPTNLPEPTPDPALAVAPTTATAAEPTPVPAAGAVQPTAVVPPTPTPAAPIVGEVRIEAGNNPGSWTRITVDGQTIYEDILPPGTVQPFIAQNAVEIRAGNAGVVYVTINGQQQGPLGESGRVATVNWPPP